MGDYVKDLVCIFCFDTLVKQNDRNLIEGRAEFSAVLELSDLPFVVRQESKYICKRCLGLLKKRKALRAKYEAYDDGLLADYKRFCAKRGLTVKTKNQAKRALPFCGNTNNSFLNPIVAQDSSCQPKVQVTPKQFSGSSTSSFLSQIGLPCSTPLRTSGSQLSIQSPFLSPQPQPLGTKLSVNGPLPISKATITPVKEHLQKKCSSSSSNLITPSASVGPSLGPDSTANRTVSPTASKVPLPTVTNKTTQDASTQTTKKKVDIQHDKAGKKITPVFVRVEWESGEREKQLPQSLCSVGKMLLRGTFKQIAAAAWRCYELKPYLIKEVLKSVHTECANLCSRKEPSLLRKTSKADMLDFGFEKLGDELKVRTPLLHGILRTACLRKAVQESDISWLPPVCMAAAVCFKNRSPKMTSVQLLVSVILQHCGLTAAMSRLRIARLTVSHPYIHKRLDDFGKRHDEEIMKCVEEESHRLKVQHLKPENESETEVVAEEQKTQSSSNARESFMSSWKKLKLEITGHFSKDIEHNIGQKFACTSQIDETHDEIQDLLNCMIDKVSKECETVTFLTPDVHVPSETASLKSPLKRKRPILSCFIDMGRKQTFDNIDYLQTVHHMNEEHQNIIHHWTSYMSTENRISGNHLPEGSPQSRLEDMENGKCIPDRVEHCFQRQNYVHLVSKICTEHMPCLQFLSSQVPKHMHHRYSEQTSKPTKTVFHGCIYENENDADGIHKVLKVLHKFVPYAGDGENQIYAEQGNVGDQLSVERAVNCVLQMSNGFTPEERLEGLHFECGDFHGGMKFLQLGYDNFYNGAAARDNCTMFADSVLINRRNVGSDVRARVSACKQFFLMEVDCRVVAAALEELHIKDIDDVPDEIYLPKLETNLEKRVFLKNFSGTLVDKYILQLDKVELLLRKTCEAQNKETVQNLGLTNDGRFMCRHPGCPKTFRYDGKRRQQHEETHGIAVNQAFRPTDVIYDSDDMYNYQLSLLEYGMLVKNFYDAISEGDGERLFRCWKFILLYLKSDGKRSSKYSLEAFYLISQYYALLSERHAHRLIWNRFAKSLNGLGGNIPLDLALEHLNRLLKNCLRMLGPNATNHNAVDRYCKALVTTKRLIDQWDRTGAYIRQSGRHIAREAKNDLRKIVKELMEKKALRRTEGRNYIHYRSIKPSLIAHFDMTVMFKWINEHKQKVHLSKVAR